MKRIFIKLVSLIFFISGCAVQKAPSGGPADTTPPLVTVVSPTPGAVNLTQLDEIHLKFSENINRSSFMKSIRITPVLNFKKKFKWKGDKEVIISIEDTLKKNTTYTITVGTELTDMHQVKLAKPVLIPFSTDSIIYQCRVRGSVFNTTPQSDIIIAAFPLEAVPSDTPWFHIPSTLETTTAASGQFLLNYLRPGTYRILAYTDNNFDRRFQPESDSWAVFPRDVQLKHNRDSVINLFTRFSMPDTTTPALKKIIMPEKNRLRLEFNRKLSLNSGDFQVRAGSRRVSALLQQPPRPIDVYTAWIKNDSLSDSLHISCNTGSFSFQRTIANKKTDDSLKHSGITFNPPESVYFEDTLHIKLNTPVAPDIFKKVFSLKDEKHRVKVLFFWNDYVDIGFIPEQGWEMDKKYTLVINSDAMTDFWDRPMPDTVITATISTNSEDDLGGFSAQFESTVSSPTAVFMIKDIKSGRVFTRIREVGQDKTVEINDLPEGRFILSGWFESTGDKLWSRGRLLPFGPSENLFYSKDTIKIRPRWIKDGFHIKN